jgi:hypothetical protein
MHNLTLTAHTGADRARCAVQIGSLRLLQTTEPKQFGVYRSELLLPETWKRWYGGDW